MSRNIFKTKTKNIAHFNVGGFLVDFWRNDKVTSENKVTINTVSRNFSATLTDYTFGYLLASVKDGDTKELHSFCAMLYTVGNGAYRDAELAADIVRSVGEHFKRLDKMAASEAESVTEADEQAAQAYMDSVVEYADADEARRAEIRREGGEILREILKEQGEKED